MGNETYSKLLDQRAKEGTLRSLSIENDGLIDFCSNDYLGLKEGDSQLLLDELRVGQKLGSGAARLITGNSVAAEQLETLIADFHSSPVALLAPTGYTANLSLLSTLARRGDCVIFDVDVHASIRDGISLSHAKSKKFQHNDLEHLEELLSKTQENSFVVVESVYSMKGDLAPLQEIAELCTRYGARLIVDEAHAVGIYGPAGEGLVVAYGLEGQVFCRVVTFGKSLGCFGAAILSDKVTKEYLVNFARPLIYSTFLSPILIETIRAQYHRLFNSSSRRQALFDAIETYEQGAKAKGISLESSHGAIRTITLGDPNLAQELANSLKAKGFLVKAIRSPTVPEGSEMLRVVLHSYNSSLEIGDLLQTLVETDVYGQKDLHSRNRD